MEIVFNFKNDIDNFINSEFLIKDNYKLSDENNDCGIHMIENYQPTNYWHTS